MFNNISCLPSEQGVVVQIVNKKLGGCVNLGVSQNVCYSSVQDPQVPTLISPDPERRDDLGRLSSLAAGKLVGLPIRVRFQLRRLRRIYNNKNIFFVVGYGYGSTRSLRQQSLPSKFYKPCQHIPLQWSLLRTFSLQFNIALLVGAVDHIQHVVILLLILHLMSTTFNIWSKVSGY